MTNLSSNGNLQGICHSNFLHFFWAFDGFLIRIRAAERAPRQHRILFHDFAAWQSNGGKCDAPPMLGELREIAD